MRRIDFIRTTGILAAGQLASKNLYAFAAEKPSLRPLVSERRFHSTAIENAIREFKSKVINPDLCWMFENCFPNTVDTTVFYSSLNGKPDTYVITGDIDAMWLRDSSAQVWPYLQLAKEDAKLKDMIAGVINRQARCILKDPYANAFYKDEEKISEWHTDMTTMKPGIHERKWEIDSLCYPIRLSYHYWKTTGDASPFDEEWQKAIALVVQTFKEQQRRNGRGPYHFQRHTSTPTDTLPIGGYGFPIKPVGLICSMFRPSDDATIYPFLIPSNLFAVVSLQQAGEILTYLHNPALAGECTSLAKEVQSAVEQFGVRNHPTAGKIYAYEVDGFGNANFMDDANIPSLLALPYLGAVNADDPIYQNTRRFVLSENNPFYYKSGTAEGIGGPHVGSPDMIWPLSIISRGLTSNDPQEIQHCIEMLMRTHAGTGFIHESFNKNDPSHFTRKWFAWANTIFGEFLWQTLLQRPQILQAIK